MRTVPFFRTPGYYNGYFCIDGGVSQYYAIPDEYFDETHNCDSNGNESNESNESSESSEDRKENESESDNIEELKTEKDLTGIEIDTISEGRGEKEREREKEKENKPNDKKQEEKKRKMRMLVDDSLCFDRVIRIAVSGIQHADIYPNSKDSFRVKEWVTSGTLDDNIGRFKAGYRSCAQESSLIKLLSKGLKWKQNDTMFNNYNNWDQHILDRMTIHENQIREHFKS